MVLTFSDTRTASNDTSGDAIVSILTAAGHEIVSRGIVREQPQSIRDSLGSALALPVDAIVTTGGTGIAQRDIVIDLVEPLFDKKLDGFGEAFRRLSWEQVGARAVLSRATAGTVGDKLLVALPGSEPAVRLGVTDVLLPFLGHAVALLRGQTAHPETQSTEGRIKK